MLVLFFTFLTLARVREAFTIRLLSEMILCAQFLSLNSNLFGSQDYSSLFPLDDTQPSKLMRLLSSNEDEPAVLSSPGESETWNKFMVHGTYSTVPQCGVV